MERHTMSMADTPLQDRLTSAASHAGTAIRYSFYLGGAFVFALVGIGVSYVWFNRVQQIDTLPAFRLAASQLTRLSASGHVVTGGRLGRVEVLQYGQLHSRNVDLTAVLVMPKKGTFMATEAGQLLRDVRSLRPMRAVYMPNYYDLETRFGEMRAADMRVQADGRWKLCLSFLSRFDTASVYLAGWYCDASGAKPSAEALACALDRLVLDKPLATKDADTFIRARMARSATCSAVPVSQTVDTRSRTSKNSPARWSMPSARRY
jgi:hypothetical protein